MEFDKLCVEEVRSVMRYRPSARRWDAAGHTEHIVGIQITGSARHDFADRSFVIPEGAVYFLNAREDYHVEVYEVGEAFSIHFTTREHIDTGSFCIPLSNVDPLLSVLEKAEIAKNTEDSLLLASLVYRFCAELWRARCKSYIPKDARMLFAKEYIDLHFKEGDCMERAIAQSGVGARRFRTLFQNSFGVTPNRYVVFRRTEHAKALFSTHCLSVTDVAELCGFSDVYYFSKVFKSETGLSPSEWRARERH